jgi:hypothetical protein
VTAVLGTVATAVHLTSHHPCLCVSYPRLIYSLFLLFSSLLGGRTVVHLAEGQETDDFWTFLGGKAAYPSTSKG